MGLQWSNLDYTGNLAVINAQMHTCTGAQQTQAQHTIIEI